MTPSVSFSPFNTKVSLFPVGTFLFSAQRLLAHLISSCSSSMRKSSMRKEPGRVVIWSTHSIWKYPRSGWPASPPSSQRFPSIVKLPSLLTARSILSPVIRFKISRVERLGKTRNIRATIPFDNKMLLPSGVAYMPAFDREGCKSQSKEVFSKGSPCWGNCLILSSNFFSVPDDTSGPFP